MSFFTDGTQAEKSLPSGTVWPGEVDPRLKKAYDCNYHSGPPIVLPDNDINTVSPPQRLDQATGFDKRKFLRLGDDNLFRSNELVTNHSYNAVKESIPNTTLLSVRDWR